MMRIWILRPADGLGKSDNPWKPDYDKAHGFVVRAKDPSEARRLAGDQAGDEGPSPWLSEEYSTCVELKKSGVAGVLVRDFVNG